MRARGNISLCPPQFTTLLVHQSAIEETLTQHSEAVMDDKLPASRAMYRSVDRKCESMFA